MVVSAISTLLVMRKLMFIARAIVSNSIHTSSRRQGICNIVRRSNRNRNRIRTSNCMRNDHSKRNRTRNRTSNPKMEYTWRGGMCRPSSSGMIVLKHNARAARDISVQQSASSRMALATRPSPGVGLDTNIDGIPTKASPGTSKRRRKSTKSRQCRLNWLCLGSDNLCF